MIKTKVIDRIRKLLSLANSSNEHEAAAAAAQAAKLQLEYKLSVADLDLSEASAEPVECIEVDDMGRRYIAWKGHLANVLARSLGCRMYTELDNSVSMTIVGRRSDVETISYMYQYLGSELARLAAESLAKAKCTFEYTVKTGAARSAYTRTYTRSFLMAAVWVIAGRLDEVKDEVEAKANSKALAIVKKDERDVERAYDALGLETRSSGRTRHNRSGASAGTAAGAGVSLGGGKGIGRGAAGRLGSGS